MFDVVPALPPPGIYVGLDRIRLTGPEAAWPEIRALVGGVLPGPVRTGSGAKFFQEGLHIQLGVLLSRGHRSEILQLDVRGERLRTLSGDARVVLLRRLISAGLRPTRLDVALDLIGQQQGVVNNVQMACEAGELCGPRGFACMHRYRVPGVPQQLMMTLGDLSSAAFVRVYDKGLEQDRGIWGHWERVEVEFKSDRAREAGRLITARNSTHQTLIALVVGAFDFRLQTGRTALSRRPRSSWWAQLVDGVETIRMSPASPDRSFNSYAHWFRSVHAPRLMQFAQAVGATVGEVVHFLAKDCEPRTHEDVLVQQFSAAWSDDRCSSD